MNSSSPLLSKLKIQSDDLMTLKHKFEKKIRYKIPQYNKEDTYSTILGSSKTDIKQDDAPVFWQRLGTRGSGVNVAIIDTGVDKSHTNMSGRILDSINFANDLKVCFEVLQLNDMNEFNYFVWVVYYCNYYRGLYDEYFEAYYTVLRGFFNCLKEELYFESYTIIYQKTVVEVDAILTEMESLYISILRPYMDLDGTIRIHEVYEVYLKHFEYQGSKYYYEQCGDSGNLCYEMHGTHVASICSGNEETDYTGIAPESGIYDLCVQSTVIPDGLFFIQDALRWVAVFGVQNNINVVNMSLGGTMPWGSTEFIINDLMSKNIIVLAATGNSQDYENAEATGDENFVGYPAGYPNVLAIGSLGRKDQDNNVDYSVSSFYSEIGPNIDYCLPGRSIVAAYSNASSDNINKGVAISGTSMATPYAAGIVCLLVAYLKNNNVVVDNNFVRRINYLLSKMAKSVYWQDDNTKERFLCKGFDVHVGYGRMTIDFSELLTDVSTSVKNKMLEMSADWKPEYVRS